MFYIHKKSRAPMGRAYRGPTCLIARVKPQYYSTREAAELDAGVLSHVNPVGFEVTELTPSEAVDVLNSMLAAQIEWQDRTVRSLLAEHGPKP
jgi:hypothetical protein